MAQHNFYLDHAIKLANKNVQEGGGPFGAVIVKDDKFLCQGVNKVVKNCDPTCHAEISAIRNACSILNTHELTDCSLYSSCRPCPMCLSAIYWSNIKTVYYASSSKNAEEVGFADEFIYDELDKNDEDKNITIVKLDRPSEKTPFVVWEMKNDKILY